MFKAKTQTPIYINYKNLPSDESLQYEDLQENVQSQDQNPKPAKQQQRRDNLFGLKAQSTNSNDGPRLLLAPFDPKFALENSHSLLYLGEVLHIIRPVLYGMFSFFLI